MNGVTGRMGANQHLERSILAIRAQGGVKISSDEVIMPRPLLVGRNARKLETLARESDGFALDHGSGCGPGGFRLLNLFRRADHRRAVRSRVRKAIAAGKHVYCEKPSADSLEAAYELYQLAQKARREAWRGAG